MYADVMKAWKSNFKSIWKFSEVEELKFLNQPNSNVPQSNLESNALANPPNFSLLYKMYFKELGRIKP
jgi:hypothetical protein